jgi:NAD(P)-dependent dehydrogenase (short-subunit alcohol dehydrogenase family)
MTATRPDRSEETAGLIDAAGGRSAVVVAPVGPSETADLLVDAAVDGFGRLDAMIANAGVLRDRVLWKTSDEEFDIVVETHLRGAFTCGRAAATHFREAGDGGRIILVGSPWPARGRSSWRAPASRPTRSSRPP